MKNKQTRRTFIRNTATAAAGMALASPGAASAPATRFTSWASSWQRCYDRIWLGPELWANPLQDWRIAAGRIENTNAAPDRNVHLLTRQLGEHAGRFETRVRLGRVRGALGAGKGSAGFRVGIMGPLRDYRNSLFFGQGLNAGVTAEGGLFIGNVAAARPGTVNTDLNEVELRLTAEPLNGKYRVALAAFDVSGKELAKTVRDDIAPESLAGNVALVANFGAPARGGQRRGANAAAGPGDGEFWFADWRLEGTKLTANDWYAFGPILFSQYTLSSGVLKLTAQMPPVGDKESQTVRLEVQRNGRWERIGAAPIHPEARTATFRVENWDATRQVAYRVAYTELFNDGQRQEHYWTGTIRRDPVDRPVLTVADISCNFHAAFPNVGYVARLAQLDPDLIAFTGDQFYESTAGYGVTRAPLDRAILDYLRKWWAHGWTWRELTRDRPSVSIPDDHDVYQGNIWGEKGAPRKTTQEAGGYDMPAAWVNVVHRTQTSHHPDPFDPTPCEQGISVYYGALTYGRVSFAILADRQFKSAPEGKVPPTGGRGDHVKSPDFDPKTADLPGLDLLGERQMKFLGEWISDWRGADMKAVISQTIFTAMATTHGPERMRLRADYDTNAWPQSARNEALKLMRKVFAVHLAGDQHLPAVVHYGIETHGDAGIAFAGPAVNVGYPRWWEPEKPGANRRPGAPEITGEFVDHFGHPLTVLAVANGAMAPQSRAPLELMREKASGMGVVRFDKAARRITIECWPYLADPTQPGTQFPGWPVSFDVLENYGRKPVAYLPTVRVRGLQNPVVRVLDERTGELVYALRIVGTTFKPHVFAEGRYTIEVSEPETGRKAAFTKVEATPGGEGQLEINL